MVKSIKLLTAVLLFASFMMGHSITVVIESHSHDQEHEHINIEESYSQTGLDLSIENRSKPESPVHEHSFLKISSHKVVGRSLFTYPATYPSLAKAIKFSFPEIAFTSQFITSNFRPPIFS